MACSGCNKSKNLVKRVKSIITGFSNLIVKNKDVEVIANRRFAICISCGDKKVIGKVSGINEPIMYCNICKCYLSAKVRSLEENCPLKKW